MGVEGEEAFRGPDGSIQDDYRIEFIKEHLTQLARGIDEGSNRIGYHLWTFIDCWSWLNAYKNRYGLVELDLETLGATHQEKRALVQAARRVARLLARRCAGRLSRPHVIGVMKVQVKMDVRAEDLFDSIATSVLFDAEQARGKKVPAKKLKAGFSYQKTLSSKLGGTQHVTDQYYWN